MINEIEQEFAEAPEKVNELLRLWRVFTGRGVVLFGMIVIIILILTAFFAPFIAPYDPYDQNLETVLLSPSMAHLLGTDAIGRDILSRIIFGSRNSLMVGIVALGIAATVGMIMGLTAGYFGGWVQAMIMRFIDALMSFPMILLALIFASLLGGGLRNVMIALGISLLPGYARIMCGQVLSVKENDYILADRQLLAQRRRDVIICCERDIFERKNPAFRE